MPCSTGGRVEFGHGAFSRESDASHYFDLMRDGQLAAAGTLLQGSLSSVGDSGPQLLSWTTAGTIFRADLVPNLLETDPVDTAQSLTVDQRGSSPLPPASSVFRTASGISGGVWVQSAGIVEVSGWSDGLRQVQSSHPIASEIEAMNVGATDRAPREVAFGFGSALVAVTGLESADIAQRQVVFAPSLRPFEQFTFEDVTVSSDTSCNKVSARDIIDHRPNAPVLKGATQVTAVISHAVGEPGTGTRLVAREVRVLARHADSTAWREVFDIDVPNLVTSTAVVASRNRGCLLVGTSSGPRGEPFQLNLDPATGEVVDLELMGITPRAIADKLFRPPVAGDNRLPGPVAGSPYVVKVDSVMTRRGPVRIRGANPGGLTLAPGLR